LHPTKAETPPKNVEVSLKDFTVKQVTGYDYVEIPDGKPIGILGKPYIPFFQKTYTYSKDFSVQNVEIVIRKDMKEGKGLKIPIYKIEMDPKNPKKDTRTLQVNDWFPEKEFEWSVEENPDGSKTLTISMYPFYYNEYTTEYKYYKGYQFNVNYINTFVQINQFEADKVEFNPTEIVTLSSKLTYTENKPKNLIAAVILMDANNNEVEKLPIKDLSDVQTKDLSISFEWNNEKHLTGRFFATLQIKNYEGEMLDFRQTGFTIGIAQAKLTDLLLQPEKIKPGDNVSFTVKMKNTGSVALSGQVILKLLDETNVIKKWEKNFESIKPGELFEYQDMWTAIEVKEGKQYTLIANAYYNSQASEPLSAFIGTNAEHIIIRLMIGKKTFYVNDIQKEMDTEPMILQGRTLLPIRYIAEALGAQVSWNAADRKTTISFKDTTIELWIGKNIAKVNGVDKPIDSANSEVKPIVVPPGRTMLPIRFVAESLNSQVDWNNETKEVTITYPK